MGRAAKILVGIVVVVAIAAVALALTASMLADRKLTRVVQVNVPAVPYTTAPEAIAHGKYLYQTRGCMECHGADGGGEKAIIDAPNGFLVKAPDITSGPGGVVAAYKEVDWVRTIRHGVKPNGNPLLVMPSDDYNLLSDDDLAAVVAYVRSLPPVAGEGAVIRLPLPIKALYAFGGIKDAAERIDHSLPPSPPITAGANPVYGAYLSATCAGCHGPGFSGGHIPGTPPEWPSAANLTPGAGSVMPRYASVDAFKAMLHTGKRPDGSAVSTVMPFNSFKNLTDTDINALYQFLATLPPKAAGNR